MSIAARLPSEPQFGFTPGLRWWGIRLVTSFPTQLKIQGELRLRAALAGADLRIWPGKGQCVITDAAKTNPKAKGQTPETLKVLDGSLLDEIKKSGFIEKVKGSY
jgi:hypothetical protein